MSIFWKRRDSARSRSNDCLTSLKVVEPMHRSWPLASAGFSRFPASMAPPDAAPAPDQRVDLVDEENRVLLLRQPIEHLLHALLEVAAIARARDQRAEIEREDPRALQHVRNLALVDAQRQAFRQRRLPHSGFANQQRVVLAAPAQHLNHALDLERPADERIDLPGRGPGHEIRRIRLQRIRRRRALLPPSRSGRRFSDFAP